MPVQPQMFKMQGSGHGAINCKKGKLASSAIVIKCCGKIQPCVRCKYSSPINLQNLLPLLDLYPDKVSAKILREGFSFGFKLGYRGNRTFRDSSYLKSVIIDPVRALAKVMKEMELDRIAGPFFQNSYFKQNIWICVPRFGCSFS